MVGMKRQIAEYGLIVLGSVLYAVSTVLFIFPNGLLLGGTSGISVILEAVLPFSPGTILMIINFSLIVLAFFVLGRDMAVKTLVGSMLTTVFVGVFERMLVGTKLSSNVYVSAVMGAALIAVASGMLFFVDSSSGGTDVIALIVKKFSGIHIGRALLLTDVVIVIVGGVLAGVPILIASFAGLLIKTLGIDAVIACIKRLRGDGRAR